jgi:nicotinamidase-related amidase
MRRALLVVDIQEGLFRAEPHPLAIELVIENINKLAKSAREAGDIVVLVQHEAPGTELSHGSPDWQLDSRLEVASGDVRIGKTTSAPFASSELHRLLQEHGVKEVVVAGYATEFCIDSTVRWSASLGYAVTLVTDAHTTHDKEHLSAPQIVAHHNATLPSIKSLGAPIRGLATAAVWQVH